MVTFDLKISLRGIGTGKLEHKRWKNHIFLLNEEWSITTCNTVTICLKFVLNSKFFSTLDLSNFDFWQLPEHSGREGSLSAFSWCGICCWQAQMTNTSVLWPNVFAIVFIRLWDVARYFDSSLQYKKWIKYQRIIYFMCICTYLYFNVYK